MVNNMVQIVLINIRIKENMNCNLEIFFILEKIDVLKQKENKFEAEMLEILKLIPSVKKKEHLCT